MMNAERRRLRPQVGKGHTGQLYPIGSLGTSLFIGVLLGVADCHQRRNLCRLFCRLPGADKHGQDRKEGGNNKDQRRGRYGCTHHRVFKVNDLCHDRKQHPTGKETGDQTNRQSDQREPDRLTVHNALDLPCGSANRPQQAVLTNICITEISKIL